MLRNHSGFAARNPGLRIVLEGVGGLREQAGCGILAWPNMICASIFQWDGGADYIIHGKWSLTLPQLDLDGAFVYPTEQGPALITITAADGVEPN